MAKKAKWLEEGTQESLLVVIKDTLTLEEIEPKAQKKALNAVNELIERLPREEITIVDNLDTLVTLANTIKEQYNTEAEMVSEDEEENDIEDSSEDSDENANPLADLSKKELKAMAKDLGIKVDKKAGKDDIIALIEEANSEEEDLDEEALGEEDDQGDESVEVADVLSELSLKDLKKIAKTAEISVKGMKQNQIIEELLSCDDIEEILADQGFIEIEEDENEEEEVDYSEMSKAELKALLKERGFKVSKKATTEEMIEMLENN